MGTFPDNPVSDYILANGDSISLEFEFIHLANPRGSCMLYRAGATGNSDPGIALQVNTDGSLYLLTCNGTTRTGGILVSSKKLTIGYNHIIATANFTTNVIALNINGTTNSLTRTNTGGTIVNTSVYLFSSAANNCFPCYMIRFRFTKNGIPLHEYFFNDGIQINWSGTIYYMVPDLIGSFNMYLLNCTSYPFTGIQNSNYYLQDNGYDLYGKFQYPDVVFAMPKRVSGSRTDTIGFRATRFVFIEHQDNLKFGYHAWGKIDMNPTGSFDSYYDRFDITNRTYWKAAIVSDPYYNATNKYWLHKSWLNKTSLDNYTTSALITANRNMLNFYDVGENLIKGIRDIKVYAFAVIRSDNDVNFNTRLTNIYFKRPLKTGTITGYLIAISGNKWLFRDGNNLYLSTDKGLTYGSPYNISVKYSVSSLDKYYFLSNGTMVAIPFGKNKIFYSIDNNITWSESSYKNKDGTTFSFHIPQNSSYPGNYFSPMACGLVEYNGIVALGNYSNANSIGAAPSIIWYSVDFGITWKVAYEFGQNPSLRDNGTPTGGTTGTLLGDPTNPLIDTHCHAIKINPADGSFWGFFGDSGLRNHWMRGVYNPGTDAWIWADLKDPSNNNRERFRTIDPYFKDSNHIIVGNDGGMDNSEGFWTATINSLNVLNTWVAFSNLPNKSIPQWWIGARGGGTCIYSVDNLNYVWYTLNGGASWAYIKLYTEGAHSPFSLPVTLVNGMYSEDSSGWRCSASYSSDQGGLLYFVQ